MCHSARHPVAVLHRELLLHNRKWIPLKRNERSPLPMVYYIATVLSSHALSVHMPRLVVRQPCCVKRNFRRMVLSCPHRERVSQMEIETRLRCRKDIRQKPLVNIILMTAPHSSSLTCRQPYRPPTIGCSLVSTTRLSSHWQSPAPLATA